MSWLGCEVRCSRVRCADRCRGPGRGPVRTEAVNFGSWAQIGADRTWCWPNHLQPSHLSDLAGWSAPIWAHEPKLFGVILKGTPGPLPSEREAASFLRQWDSHRKYVHKFPFPVLIL